VDKAEFLEPFFIAKRFQTSKNALGEARTLSVPARGYPPLDPDPLLKSGGNIIGLV
jgi:hypothetical protein